MTVASTYTPPQYAGDGTTRAFAFPFLFFAPSDLTVTLFTAATNTTVVPVLNGTGAFDYTVTGTLDTGKSEYVAGATVTCNTAPPGGTTVTITRGVAATQQTALGNNAPFPASVIEASLDRLTILVQQALVAAGRAITQPTSDPALVMTLPPAALRASQLLGFDASGDVIAAQPTSTLISAQMIAVVQAVSLGAAAALLATGGADVGAFLTKAIGGNSLVPLNERFGFVLTPQDFGAKGDGVTDDTASIQALVTYVTGTRSGTNSGGKVFIPPGFYIVSSAITVAGAIVIEGAGRGTSGGLGNSGGTCIRTISTTADVFTVTTIQDVQFLNLRIDSGVVKTAGNGITIAPGGTNIALGAIIRGCTIANMVICINLVGCADYTIEANRILDFAQCGIYDAATASNPDAGDAAIVNNTIWAQNTNPTDGCIRLDPAAGIEIIGNKILGGAYSIRLSVTQGPTGTLNIVGNSLEEYTMNAIRIEQTVSGKTYGNIIIANNEIENDIPTTPQAAIAIVAGGASVYLSNVSIHDNALNIVAAGSYPVISVQDGTNVNIHDNEINLGGAAGSSAISTGGFAANCVVHDNRILGVSSARFYSAGLANTTVLVDRNGMLVAQLATWANGSEVYVTDGHATSFATGNLTLTGSGTGCYAFRTAGAWLGFST